MSADGERAAVLAEMRRAHLAEIGARALYGWLARLARDAELRRLMEGLEEEEAQQIERMLGLMRGLGEEPRKTSRRRRAVSMLMALSTPVFGPRPVLRLCEEAEGTASRWYAHFAEHFRQTGAADAAATCLSLAQVKAHHAQALRAWVDNAPRR